MGDKCRYQGYEFGASYPDSVCIDGWLWDADSGEADPDGGGWMYDHGGEDVGIPCPCCREKDAVEYWFQRNRSMGGLSVREAKATARSLVADIRSTRNPDGSFAANHKFGLRVATG
jgi:hypothetical protein